MWRELSVRKDKVEVEEFGQDTSQTTEKQVVPAYQLDLSARASRPEWQKGRFFALSRKRSLFFADVGELVSEQSLEYDQEICRLPTQPYGVFMDVIVPSVFSQENLTEEEYPTIILAASSLSGSDLSAEVQFAPDEAPAGRLVELFARFMPWQRREVGSEGVSDFSLKKLLKSSGVYALASLAIPFVSLALSPFLTRHLSHSDYGLFAVLTTTIALLAGISQVGLSSAFFRAYNYDYETSEDRVAVISTTLALLLCCTIPLMLVLILFAPWISQVLLGSASRADTMRLAALVILLQNISMPAFAWMRAETRAALFAVLSILNLLFNLGMTLLLVGVYHLGIDGALLGMSCGYGFVVMGACPLLLKRVYGHVPRRDIAFCLLSFGFPNAVSFVSAWVLQLADRFLLAHMRSLSETATYSVAYSLGSVLSVVVLTPFSMAWPSTMFSIARRRDAGRIFQKIFRWYGIVLLFMAYALTLVAIFVLDVFFPVNYREGSSIIPLVALSIMFFGVYNFLTLGIGICRKVWYAVLFVAFAALVNIGANVLLIPIYGIQGAAEATLIAYVALAVLTYLLNQRIYPVPFEIDLFGLGLGLALLFYAFGGLLAQGRSFWLSWVIDFGMLILYGFCLFALGRLWSLRDRSQLRPEQEEMLVVTLAKETIPSQR